MGLMVESYGILFCKSNNKAEVFEKLKLAFVTQIGFFIVHIDRYSSLPEMRDIIYGSHGNARKIRLQR